MRNKTGSSASLLDSIDRDLLYGLLDNPYESLILVDKDGVVRFMSSINEGIYAVKIKDAIGRPIQEVSPGTRIHQTLKTGRAEIGNSMDIQGKKRVVARFPIYRDGEVIGAAGKLMFLNPEQLKELYDKIARLEKHISYYKSELGRVSSSRYGFEHIVGESGPMRAAKALALKAAGSDTPVIVTGESGTGKELFVHAIHGAGKRRENALVRVNCASIPKDLFESELFGYAPGAFTGAGAKGRPGKFELAHKGTIFLDEIGDMPLSMQAKLLRVLQEKEIEPVGATKPRRIDFRLVSATNQDLEALMAAGGFRLDLFYRINLMVINLPPLRSIKEDIPLLANHFLAGLGSRNREYRLSPEAMKALAAYSWPGNIRELQNIVERAVMVSADAEIGLDDLPLAVLRPAGRRNSDAAGFADMKTRLEEAEKKAILEALAVSGNNRAKASGLLGIHRTGLYQKMKKYGI